MQDERLSAPSDVERARRTSPWWGLHAARYVFAREYVQGVDVLDVACGTGYGLRLLAEVASLVGGADVDETSLHDAANVGGLGGSWVTAASGCHLPFRSDSFDVVTSFETIEHLEARAAFVHEVARVLRPDGLLLLSTPNARYTNPVDGKPANPFHVHEYTPDELRHELSARFEVVEMLGQTLSTLHAISPFIDDQLRLPRRPVPQMRRFVWRVMNKLPKALRETISRRVWGRPFYPTEHDYEFRPDTLDGAPVTVAVCRLPMGE